MASSAEFRDPFWYIPSSLPGITDEQVRTLEGQFERRLPAELLAHLKRANGGSLRRDLFHQPPSDNEGHSDNILEVGLLHSFDYLRWQNSIKVYRKMGLPVDGLIEFGSENREHHLLCFDYRSATADGEPSVIYLRYRGLGPRLECFKVANTFAQFEASLFSDLKYDCYSVPGAQDEALAMRVLKAAGVVNPEIPPNPYGERVPQGEVAEWRAAPVADQEGNCGFLCFERNVTPGGLIQFPELPSQSWIFSAFVHPGHRGELMLRLSAAGIRVQVLHLVDWNNWTSELSESYLRELRT